jgi:hypothetical protein
MSVVQPSPIMSASRREGCPNRAKAASKNSLAGLETPISSEIMISAMCWRIAWVKDYSYQPKNLPKRDAFRPVVVEKRAVGIEQEPLVAVHRTLIKVGRGAVKTKPACVGSYIFLVRLTDT